MRKFYPSNFKAAFVFSLLFCLALFAHAQPNFGIDVPSPQEKLDVNGAIRIGNTANSNAGSIRYTTISQKFQVNINGTWYDLATTSNAQITNVTYNPTTNIITISEGGNNFTVDLTELEDNTDDQAISYNATTNVITLEDGGTIDLSDLQDNTDEQTLLEVYGENGNAVLMNSTSGDVRFYNAGGEVFILKESTGNVGIGTTTPSSKLHVTEASTGNAAQITESGDGNALTINESGNGNSLTITQGGAGHAATIMGGNVGIGTTNPAQILEVTGRTRISTLASGASGAVVTSNSSGDMSYSNFPNDNDQVLDGTGSWVDINTMVNGDYIENQTSANQAAGFRITGNGLFNGGNVGVGTISPSSLLNVYDADESTTQTAFTQAVNNAGILVSTDYFNAAYTPGIFWNTINDNPSKPKGGIYLQTNNDGSKMILATSTNYVTGITNNALTIDQEGNVGINSTSPSYKLDVAGNVRSQGWATIGTGADRLNLELQSTFHRMAFNELRFYDWNTGADMVTFNNGNVGINTSGPNDALDVVGSADVTSTYKLQGTNAIFGSASDVYGNLRVIQNNSGSSTDGMYINYNSTGGTAADLRLFANGTNERIRIKANTGFVGIGTNNPAQMLEIYRDNNDVAIRLHDPGNTHYAIGSDYSDGGKLKINYGSYPGENSHLTMTTAGSLGIGSNVPAQRLDVVGDINSSSGYRIGNGATAGQYLRGNGSRFVSSAIQPGDLPGGNGNYIQNQYGSAQSANSWISGTSRANSGMRAPYFTVSDYNSGIPGGDGSFYRNAGQTEIMFDDWLYYRDANDNGVRISFNIDDGSIRPYILYDLNNTGYYLNPDGTSNLRDINTTNTFNTDVNDSWFPYSNNWNYFRGNTYAWNATWYDENNTAYYINPNGSSRFYNINTLPGFDGYYPSNNAIRMTPNFHFNTPAGYATIINWDNGSVGGGTWQFRVGNGAGSDQFYVRADGGAYGRWFGDLDDGGYYLDPNSTSNTAGRVRGGIVHGPNPSWGAYLLVGGDGRNGYVDNGNTASVSSTNGNLHMDAASGRDMYLNYYDGNNIYFGRGNNSNRALLNSNGMYLYDGWFRPHGATGVYWESYGGGWYMTDNSWVRVYNNRTMLSQINSGNPAIRGDQAYSGYYAGEFNSYNSSNGPAIYARGYIYAYTYYGYSTKDMKHDIEKFGEEDYESSLAFMDDLELNYYKFTDEYDEYPKIHVGLIAEETPTTLTAPGQKGVSYTELAVFNTGAVKALKKKVSDLEEQLSSINDFGADNIYGASMWVEFSGQFSNQLNGEDPIVVLTPSQTGTVLNLSEITKTGFRVENPNGKGVSFSWIALAKVNRKSTEKMGSKFEGMVKSAENDTRPVPVQGEQPSPGFIDPTAPANPAAPQPQVDPYTGTVIKKGEESPAATVGSQTSKPIPGVNVPAKQPEPRIYPEGEPAPPTEPLPMDPQIKRP